MLSGSGSETCLKRKFVSLKKKNCAFPENYTEIQFKIVIIHGLVNAEQEMRSRNEISKIRLGRYLFVYFQQ